MRRSGYRAGWWLLLIGGATLLLSGCAASGDDRYGAIALSADTGRIGVARDLATRAAAEEAAVRYCAADDCLPVVWFVNGCGALARQPGLITWGLGDTREEAEAAALAECGADACRVVASACAAG